jgi:hypothetical protein
MSHYYVCVRAYTKSDTADLNGSWGSARKSQLLPKIISQEANHPLEGQVKFTP